MTRLSASFSCVVALVAVVAAVWAFSGVVPRDKVQQALEANNRGVAYMARSEFSKAGQEFQTALNDDPEFVEARVNLGISNYAAGNDAPARSILQEVLKSDPGDLSTHYVLGLIHKNHGEYEDALHEFQTVLATDPRDKDANYYAGFSLSHLRRFDEAIRYYEAALRRDPNDVSTLFGLSNAYRSKGDQARAAVYLKAFQQKRERAMNKPASIVYGEEGKYALANDVVPPAMRSAPKPVPVKFVDATAATGVHFRHANVAPRFLGSGVCALDYDGDGKQDLFFVNSHGPAALYHNTGSGNFDDVTSASGLSQTINGLGCAVGDYDNDGRPDIAITEPDRLLLFHNEGGGHFREVGEQVGLHPMQHDLSVTFIDLDHDGYLDLVVTSSAPEGKVTVYRNLGTGKFKDISAESKIGQTPAAYAGLVATDYDNNRDIDVVLARSNGPASIFSNNRDGTFSEGTPWAGDPVANARGVIALDYNKDGWMDLFFTRVSGPPVLLRSTGNARFRVAPLPAGNRTIQSGWGATAIDFDNDGFVDIAFIGDVGGRQVLKLYRNRGDGSFEDVSETTGLTGIRLHNARSLIAADWDGNGDTDLVVTQAGGAPLLLRNDGGNANHSLLITASGLNDNKLGIGSKVVVRAEGLWQKTEVEGGSGYLGQNPTAQLFGLDGIRQADSISILWPTGVLQDELPGAVTAANYTELDRKGGSCPIVYAWDGRQFRFVDDVVGPGVVGEWVAPHVYDTPQTSELLRIPDGTVRERGGSYEFRFTDQMEEVVFLDRARLLAVDHPAGFSVYSNDRYQPAGNPPDFHLWRIAHARPPASAVDEAGTDLMPYVRDRDGRYAPIHARSEFRGYVGPHTLTIGLGDLSHARSAQLILDGWTDYYFPTTTWTAFHVGIGDQVPSMQVPDGRGGWKKYLDSVGMPAGLPRAIVVDLTPALRQRLFPRGDYRVRITTNLAVYWDQILVNVVPDGDEQATPMRLHWIEPESADLHYLGYPREIRRRPEAYDYNQISPRGEFRRVSGNYTRYGDVLPLLAATDDRYAIMASGDEVALKFRAALPALPKGWMRTFFFYADAFTKGAEFFDAYPDSVAPLPVHRASYPYNQREVPLDVLEYRLLYNTRHIEEGR